MFPAGQDRWTADRHSGFAAAISITLHAAAFVALVHAPAVRLPQPSESEYKQSFAQNESKIVWYKFKHELPKVSPPRALALNAPLRTENRADQAIVSSAPRAPRSTRMIWSPAPSIRDVTPLESPNVIAVKLPAPPLKPFVAPAEKPRGESAIELASNAPPLTSRSIDAARLPEQSLPPKPFVAPPAQEHQQAPRTVTAADAPAIPAQGAPSAARVAVTLAPKPFIAPRVTPRKEIARVISTPEAPEITAAAGRPTDLNITLAPKPFSAPPAHVRHDVRGPVLSADAPSLSPAASPGAGPAIRPVLGAKPFRAPPQRASEIARKGAGIGPEPAPPVLQANSKDLNLAVVGLNPADRPLPPPSSSPAEFSAGKQLRKEGASAQSSEGALAVPGLFVGHARQDTRPLAQAFDAPTSGANLRAVIRSRPPLRVGSAPSEPAAPSGAVRVTDIPDPRFDGREVYMLAIQMPNLTSYTGSWLMWYSGRTKFQAGLSPIAPPVAHRKVDPKYNFSTTADRIQGTVRLAFIITREGTVAGIQLLRGLDDMLNRSAEEALAKWEFYPATRNGAPVDVDVIVDIPFRPEPLTPAGKNSASR
jgi:TonB family protein